MYNQWGLKHIRYIAGVSIWSWPCITLLQYIDLTFVMTQAQLDMHMKGVCVCLRIFCWHEAGLLAGCLNLLIACHSTNHTCNLGALKKLKSMHLSLHYSPKCMYVFLFTLLTDMMHRQRRGGDILLFQLLP